MPGFWSYTRLSDCQHPSIVPSGTNSSLKNANPALRTGLLSLSPCLFRPPGYGGQAGTKVLTILALKSARKGRGRIGYVSIQICALPSASPARPPCQRPILNATTSPLYARRCTSLSERLHRRLASTLRVGLRSNRNLSLSSDRLPAGWVSTGCLKQQ